MIKAKEIDKAKDWDGAVGEWESKRDSGWVSEWVPEREREAVRIVFVVAF